MGSPCFKMNYVTGFVPRKEKPLKSSEPISVLQSRLVKSVGHTFQYLFLPFTLEKEGESIILLHVVTDVKLRF